jgi:hypothetical protein
MSRRIDWRFLLPSPTLNRVGIVGQPDKALQMALSHFAESVQIISPDQQPNSPFELLLYLQLSPTDISKYISWLSPNGVIYAELPTFNCFPTLRRISKKITLYESELRKAGLTNLNYYWHRPNFFNCKEIVPLQHKPALAFALAKGHSGLKGIAEHAATKIFRYTRLFPPIISHISLVASTYEGATQ